MDNIYVNLHRFFKQCIFALQAAGSKLAIDIQHHSDNLQQLGQKLTDVKKLLKSSRDSQLSLYENVDHIRSRLSKLSENYESIAKERERAQELSCNAMNETVCYCLNYK